MVPTDVIEEEVAEEEIEDGAPDETNQADDNAESVEGEGKDTDSGGEGEKTGESVEGDESEVKEEAPEVKDVDWKSEHDKLAQTVKELQERVAKPADQPEVKPRAYTEDEKAEIESKWGIPFTAVDRFGTILSGVVSELNKSIDARLSQFHKDATIVELSREKDFADINSYRTGMDEFLKKVPAAQHGNREALTDAYYYAKGRGLKNAVTKTAQSKEKNRKIAGSARPASPSSKTNVSKKGSFKMNQSEREAYDKFGKNSMTEDEYIKNLPRYKRG